MRKSSKVLLCIMIILLLLLAGVIVWLILKDDKTGPDTQTGNTVIAEMAAQSEQATQPGAPEVQEVPETQAETQTAPQDTAPSVDIPNEKPVVLYTGSNGEMQKVNGSYDSAWTVEEDIATFEAINSEEDVITYDSYYTLHENYWTAVETETDYKIGYELSFDVDGGHKVITILKPSDISGNTDLYMGDYPYDENDQLITTFITGYIGAWVYCDIGQEGIYTHLTEEDMTPETLMTSIKLRPTLKSSDISNLKLKAFTYSSDEEFDSMGRYIGTHGYEIAVNNIG